MVAEAFFNFGVISPNNLTKLYFMLRLLVTSLLFPAFMHSQSVYVGHASNKVKVKDRILTDEVNKMKFILDSTQTVIVAVDFNYKKIWATDPYRNNHLSEYKHKDPIIVTFEFAKTDKDYKGWENREVIWITYSNSVFGFVDRKTGQFVDLGQD